jgi:hypothetical protein
MNRRFDQRARGGKRSPEPWSASDTNSPGEPNMAYHGTRSREYELNRLSHQVQSRGVRNHGLPVVVGTGGAFDEARPCIGLTLQAGKIGPTALQCDVQAFTVVVAVHLSIRSVRITVPFHRHRTRFHLCRQPPIHSGYSPVSGIRPFSRENMTTRTV